MKQKFSHVVFLQHRVATKSGSRNACIVVLIFTENLRSLRIALSWNDNVLLAYHIAFAEEREQGRKQRDFAQNKAIRFVSKLTIFQKVELLTLKFIFYTLYWVGFTNHKYLFV